MDETTNYTPIPYAEDTSSSKGKLIRRGLWLLAILAIIGVVVLYVHGQTLYTEL